MKSLWLCEVFQNIFSKGEAENPNDFLALTDFITIEIEYASDTFTRFVLLCMHIAIAIIIYSCPE